MLRANVIRGEEKWAKQKKKIRTNERMNSVLLKAKEWPRRKERNDKFRPPSFSKEGGKRVGKGGEIGSLMLSGGSRDARHKARCAPSWVSFLFVPPANLWRADGVA